jgi:D-3-phosphoglycerate dehydrogenase
MKIIITDPIDPEGVKILTDAGFTVDEKPGISPEELLKIIPEYNALIVRSATKVTAEVINAGKNLKVIGRAGVGLDNVDHKAAEARGIKVVNTPEATSVSVAELALGMMFACARQIPQATASLRAGKWEKKAFKGIELYGKTLGIIGSGRIGTELAKRALALGMKVLVNNRSGCKPQYGELCSREELLSKSDFISLHIPKTPETYHLLNKEAFARMKKGVIIINCARGGVIDETALFEAIQSGQVAAAALDVYEEEPVKDFRLFSLPQVIGTPHIGAQTKEGQRRAGVQIAEKVRDALKGGD